MHRVSIRLLSIILFVALGLSLAVPAMAQDLAGSSKVSNDQPAQVDRATGVHAETPTVIETVGSGGTYLTLKAAFDAINAGTLTGAIELRVVGDTTETDTAVLNASGSGGANYSSVDIIPSNGAPRTVSGNLVDKALVALNGADNLTINGLNTGGNALTLSNSAIGASSGTATIKLYGDATNNTIENVTILGSAKSDPFYLGGTIWFSGAGTTSGNDNNVISHCNVGPAGANLPNNAIFASSGGGSSDSNTIDHNSIYDYFDSILSSHGIWLNGNSRNWTISNNRFYQTAPREFIGETTHAAIQVGNNSLTGNDGHNINGNIIGYASKAGTGTYEITSSSASPGSFYGVYYYSTGTGNTTHISGNTITAINITTNQNSQFAGIYINGGFVQHDFSIQNNTIGSLTTPGAISYSSTSTAGVDLYGISDNASYDMDISYNNVGGIAASNSAGGGITLTGLRAWSVAYATNTMTGNTVGTPAAPLSNDAAAATSSTTGLWCQDGRCYMTANTVGSLTMNGANTSAGGAASLMGMRVDTPSSVVPSLVEGNTIHSLSNTHPTAAVTVTGLYFRNGPAGTVDSNFIYGVSTSSTSPGATVNGVDLDNTGVTGNPTTYLNNMIDLGDEMTVNSPRINGFNESSGGTGNSFIFNSVYIGGSGVAAGTSNSFALYSPVVNTTRGYRNNILVNARSNSGASGKHYAISVGGTTANPAGLTSNNNVLYASGAGGYTGLFNGLDLATLANWQAATGQDADSFSADPQFLAPAVSPPNLHINPNVFTVIEGNGDGSDQPTYDFDGDTRSTLTPVDIGADAGNFTGADLLAPSIAYTPLDDTVSTTNRAFGSVAITDLSGVDTGAGTKPRVYYKRSTDGNVWNDNTSGTDGWKYVEANGSSSPFDFTIDYSRLNGGTGVGVGTTVQYFVVAQDLAPTPNVGINSGMFAVKPTSVALTGAAFPVVGVINSYQVIISFSGVYSVPGSYPSLTNAGGIFQAMNASTLTGNVVIEITADLAGETGQYALVEQSESPAGSNFTVTIKPSGAPRTITGTGTGFWVIRLFGADRVTIDGSLNGGTDRSLTIYNPSPGTGSPSVLAILSPGLGAGATHNTIKNCIINGGTVGSNFVTTWGIYVAGSAAQQGPDNDDLTIQNNLIRRVKIGIQAFGSSSASDDRLQIIGNTLGDDVEADSIGSMGMFIGYAKNVVVSRNVVKNVSNSYGSPYGMRFGSGVQFSSVERNNVTGIRYTGTGGMGGVGLEITTDGGPLSTTLSNNFISDIGGDGGSNALVNGMAGIRILGSTTGLNLYYNSVNLGSGSFGGNVNGTQSAALAITDSTFGLDIRDNIFATNLVNTNAAGAKSYAILTTATSGGIFSAIDYNDYYASGSQGVLGVLNGVDRTTLADWQTASGQDSHSIAANPVFTSPTDLHISPAAVPLASPVDNAGTPIAGVTIDYDGGMRSVTTPDIGGDEIGVALAVTLADFSTAQVDGQVRVTWETVSELDNQGFNLYRNTTPDPVGSLLAYVPSQAPGSTQGYAYSYVDGNVQPGQIYWYWLEDIDFSGATSLHGPVSATYTGPTAVALSDLDASSLTPHPIPWWTVALALTAALGGLFAVQRSSEA